MSAEEIPAKPQIISRRISASNKIAKQTEFERPGISKQIPLRTIQRAAKETIEPPLGPRSFEQLIGLLIDSTDHAACVRQLALDVAGRGWDIIAISDDVEIDKAEEEVARKFLENPNEEDTLGDILKKVVTDYRSIGNAWCEMVREGNDPNALPQQLIHAPGIGMRIRNNLAGYVMLSLETNRWAFFRKAFSDPEAETSQNDDGDVFNEMFFWKEYHPGSIHYGLPPIVPAMRAIKGSLYAGERNIRFFQNRAMPEYVVIVEGQTDNINALELNKLLDDLEEHWANVLKGDDYRTWIGYLPAGITIRLEKVSIDVNDGTHLEYSRTNRDEILRANGMMPNRIGIIETGNIGAGTGESQIEIYKASMVEPIQEMLERTINAILHRETPQGFGLKSLKFKLNDLDTSDELVQAQIASLIASTGWPTFNDGRAYLSRFSKMDFEEIPENWADLPPQIVYPQLSGVIETPIAPEMETPGFRPGVSPLGTPIPALGPSAPGSPIPATTPSGMSTRPRAPIAVDRAYVSLREKGIGRASRRDGS